AGRSTIKTIWLRASSDLQRLTKHENSILQGIAEASVEVCDKPGKSLPAKSSLDVHSQDRSSAQSPNRRFAKLPIGSYSQSAKS
ncbi:hypothetical protein, partial [Rhizobium leguminosarum]|uniref:hypothetical protein n=1 Tax=Rhizobium leguminosarum TaxID=384 RepID=UPI001954C2BB